MKRGLKYYISFEEHDLVQMIDWWDYLCEIKEDYEPWVYDRYDYMDKED